jgi:hypothetical protein
MACLQLQGQAIRNQLFGCVKDTEVRFKTKTDLTTREGRARDRLLLTFAP